jgi:2-oxoisovalerate dehydrogenase E2 component (dihydrolipoyl transacylase)
MAVGADLIHIVVEGAGNLKAGAPAAAPAAAPAKAAAPAAAATVQVAPDGGAPATAQDSSPTNAHADAGDDAPAPAGGNGMGSPKLGTTRAMAAPGAPARAQGDKPLASPSVRQRAWDHGVDLQYVHGSGPAGRITHEDLDAHMERGGAAAGNQDTRYLELHDEREVPVIGLRRKIAQKMQDAKRRIPHFSYVEEVDVTELENLRARLNEKWGKERGKLTVLPLLMRAVVLALREFPQMNARFDDEAGVVTQHAAVHLGVATQTPAGLMVAVLRHAEARDMWSCAAETARLADAARTGKATREELSGSTITITSQGALGGIVTTPVINHPEVGIIGVNKIVERPMVRNGAVVIRKMMNLSSSFDHRVVDGMDAAEFIQAIRALLECPAMLFVE